MLCRVAEVSRKCYYNHLKSPKGIEDAEILKEIRFQLQTCLTEKFLPIVFLILRIANFA